MINYYKNLSVILGIFGNENRVCFYMESVM